MPVIEHSERSSQLVNSTELWMFRLLAITRNYQPPFDRERFCRPYRDWDLWKPERCTLLGPIVSVFQPFESALISRFTSRLNSF